MSVLGKLLHECVKPQMPHDPDVEQEGPAIERCEEKEDGSLWVRNREYGSRVNFCPFCGYPAKVKMVNLVRRFYCWENNHERSR